eukprot:6463553-Amphidinium_carterae.1
MHKLFQTVSTLAITLLATIGFEIAGVRALDQKHAQTYEETNDLRDNCVNAIALHLFKDHDLLGS